RRADRDTLGSTSEEVAKVVGQLVQLIGLEAVFIVDDVVMRRTGGTLQTLMRLEVEVVVVDGGDAAVDDRTGHGVAGLAVGTGFVGGVQAGMVALADDDDGDGRSVVLGACDLPGPLAGALDLWQLLVVDLSELGF